MSEFPVEITSEALAQIRRILAREGEAGSFIRVGVKGGGCSGLEYVLRLDTSRRPDDLELLIDEIVVVCDPKSAEFLRGSTLTVSGNLIGGGFTFENPNAKRSCGCGTSFTPAG